MFMGLIVRIFVLLALLCQYGAAHAALEGPGSGLVGWWKFDEGSGATFYDSSGRGHTGTFVNSPTWVQGRVGPWALSFDGSSSFVNIPASTDFDFNTTGEFSISVWVYSKDPNTRFSAVSRSMNNLWHLWTLEQVNTGGGTARFDEEYVTRLVSGESASRARGSGLGYGANAWYHVVGVKTSGASGVVKIYINGVKGTDSAIVPNPDPDLSGLGITIGGRRSITPDAVWNGYIDEVRVYNRALSSAEIASLFAEYGNLAPNPPANLRIIQE
jgi:hypothetical protein